MTAGAALGSEAVVLSTVDRTKRKASVPSGLPLVTFPDRGRRGARILGS